MFLQKLKKIFNNNSNSKVVKNGAWIIVLQIFNMVAPLITLPYITRILSSSDYGEFSISLNWIGYLQVLVEYGFTLTGAQKIAVCEDNPIKRSVVRNNILFAQLFLLLPCFMILLALFAFAPIENVQIFCMSILFLCVISVAFQQNWFFQGISEMQNITLINVVSRSVSVALIFLLVKEPNDLYLYCLLYSSTFVIASISGCLIVWKKYKLFFTKPRLKNVFFEIKDGWSLFISSFMTKIFSNVGVTILGFIALKEEVGAYAAIYKSLLFSENFGGLQIIFGFIL